MDPVKQQLAYIRMDPVKQQLALLFYLWKMKKY
jgi:hypothetical protein